MVIPRNELLTSLVCCFAIAQVSCPDPHNNIALQSAGTTCATDKPGYKPNIGCYGAIDGSVVGSNSNDVWKFYAEAVGTWLRLTFDDFYVMKRISVMQPFWKDEKNIKKASLAFGGGSTHEITLTNQEGYYWENFTLSPNEMSDTLLITITETFEPGRRTTGFVELQVHGYRFTTEVSTAATTEITSTENLSITTNPLITTKHTTEYDEMTSSISTEGSAEGSAHPTTESQTTASDIHTSSQGSSSTTTKKTTTTTKSAPTKRTTIKKTPKPTPVEGSTIVSSSTRVSTESTVIPGSAGASTGEDDSSLPNWWILLIVVVVILVLQIIVIIAVVILIRKNNKKNVLVHPEEPENVRAGKYMQMNSPDRLTVTANPALLSSKSVTITRDTGTETEVNDDISDVIGGSRVNSRATSQWMTGSDIYDRFVVNPSPAGSENLEALDPRLRFSPSSQATSNSDQGSHAAESDLRPFIREHTGL